MRNRSVRALLAVLPLTLTVAACDEKATPPATSTPAPTATPALRATAIASGAPSAPETASDAAADASPAAVPTKSDTFTTSAGPLDVIPVHHATVAFVFAGKTIVVDPWTEGNVAALPKADYVFVTDIHPDHLDPAGIDAVKKAGTQLVGPPAVNEKQKMDVVLKNGDTKDFGAFKVEAIPMYNLVRGPAAGKKFHDKGRGDGYVFTFGDKRVYVSGDTECTPEMKALKKIDVAFVCMNLPYTMPASEAAECVKAFKPKVVFPFHTRGTPDQPSAEKEVADFTAALSGTGGDGGAPAVEVRDRKWY